MSACHTCLTVCCCPQVFTSTLTWLPWLQIPQGQTQVSPAHQMIHLTVEVRCVSLRFWFQRLQQDLRWTTVSLLDTHSSSAVTLLGSPQLGPPLCALCGTCGQVTSGGQLTSRGQVTSGGLAPVRMFRRNLQPWWNIPEWSYWFLMCCRSSSCDGPQADSW